MMKLIIMVAAAMVTTVSHAETTPKVESISVTCTNSGTAEWMRIEKIQDSLQLRILNTEAISFLKSHSLDQVISEVSENLVIKGLNAKRGGFEKYDGRMKVLELNEMGLSGDKLQLAWKDKDQLMTYDFYNCRQN